MHRRFLNKLQKLTCEILMQYMANEKNFNENRKIFFWKLENFKEDNQGARSK